MRTLTQKELDILAYASYGLANKEIAFKLGLTENTVKNHCTTIFLKLDALCRTHAVAIALRRGLIK